MRASWLLLLRFALSFRPPTRVRGGPTLSAPAANAYTRRGPTARAAADAYANRWDALVLEEYRAAAAELRERRATWSRRRLEESGLAVFGAATPDSELFGEKILRVTRKRGDGRLSERFARGDVLSLTMDGAGGGVAPREVRRLCRDQAWCVAATPRVPRGYSAEAVDLSGSRPPPPVSTSNAGRRRRDWSRLPDGRVRRDVARQGVGGAAVGRSLGAAGPVGAARAHGGATRRARARRGARGRRGRGDPCETLRRPRCRPRRNSGRVDAAATAETSLTPRLRHDYRGDKFDAAATPRLPRRQVFDAAATPRR